MEIELCRFYIISVQPYLRVVRPPPPSGLRVSQRREAVPRLSIQLPPPPKKKQHSKNPQTPPTPPHTPPDGYFKDLARGRLSGDLNGFLKIIARAEAPQRHTIIGVHVVGDGANELIQLGSVLVHSRTTLEELSNTPFAGAFLFPFLKGGK